MGLYKNTRLKPNLTPNQINGFKSLLSKRDTISFSVSVKGGEFVVMNKESQRQLTEYYLRSSTDVYRYIEPTRVNQGGICSVINPTVVSYKRQIKALTVKLQEKCNNLWKTICKRRNLDDFVTRAFMSSNTQLPVMYILLKTHKFDVCQISNATDINQICKCTTDSILRFIVYGKNLRGYVLTFSHRYFDSFHATLMISSSISIICRY